jgi:hypothetical protein
MNYSDLNLKVNTDCNTISILPGCDINVLKYASIEEKSDIIHLALQDSEENGLFNLFKIKMFFALYIIYTYTDLEFSQEEKDDPTTLYDKLKSTGVLDAIMGAMETTEYDDLVVTLEKTMKIKLEYSNTIIALLRSFIQDLPTNATEAKNIIEQFDPAAFQKVIDFATAANGNRPLI